MITWLASYPRSGNTLLRSVIHATMDVKSHPEFPPATDWFDPSNLFPFSHERDSVRPWTGDQGGPRLVKILCAPPDQQRAIHLVRDGRQVLCSHHAFLQRLPSRPCPTLLELVLGYGDLPDWTRHYRAWADNRTRLEVHYCDLVAGKSGTFRALADFIGHDGPLAPWSNPFAEYQRLAPGFFRTGSPEWHPPADWTPEVDNAFWTLHGDLMEHLGYGKRPPQRSTSANHWISLHLLLTRTRTLEAEHAETRTELQTVRHNLERVSWIRGHLRRVRRQGVKFWKSPSGWLTNHLAQSHDWRPGRLVQYAPRPFRAPVLPGVRTPDDQLPSLAVVVPSFQQAPFLDRTLRSILNERYPGLRLAVTDGGSDDDTGAILDHFRPHLHYCRSHPDNGQAGAINEGMARIPGEICHWLNSDDLMLPGSARLVGDYFRRHPEVDVVYGNRILIDGHDREIGRQVLPPHDNRELLWFDSVPQETLYFRRTAWERVGGLDPSFRFAMDWDLLLRFQEAGLRMVRLPFFLGCFRVHQGQKTQQWISSVGHAEMQRLRQRHLGPDFNEAELRQQYKHHLAHAALLAHLEQLRIYRKARSWAWGRWNS